MKKFLKINNKPSNNEMRTIKRFLLFPKKLPILAQDINNCDCPSERYYCLRWLEIAEMIQRYQYFESCHDYLWEDLYWTDV